MGGGEKKTKIERKFIKDWGEELAEKVWRAANSHANEVNSKNKGSDPFKWALLICIGYQCLKKPEYRKYHGIERLNWRKMKKWIKDNAELSTHDGDVDYLTLFAGGYNYFINKETK